MDLNPKEFEILINLVDDNGGSTRYLKDHLLSDPEPLRLADLSKLVNTGEQIGRLNVKKFTEGLKNSTSSTFLDGESRLCGKNLSGQKSRTVNGRDIGDLPIEYHITDIQDFEFPVKGFYVDKRIIPGFRYRVRALGTDSWLFNGESRLLKSVGLGYGKRITFEGDSLSSNIHFWSDSLTEGYAFSLQAVQENNEFLITDYNCRSLGRAFIDARVLPEQEISTTTFQGTITKRVRVVLSITAEYSLQRHGLLPLVTGETCIVDGIAVLVKKRGEKAVTIRIDQVNLPMIGHCTLNKKL